YDIGETEGSQYFVLKYVEGGSLAERLRCSGRMSPRAASELLLVLARAVHHAHERRILHRDLKPSNILLHEDGTPIITDFGLARATSASDGEHANYQTAEGMILGTPAYMAPEQARGVGSIGAATDIYGMGTIYYELLTGEVPFRGRTSADTLS